MPFLDRTVDFRNAVEVQRAVIPETKRRNFSRLRQDKTRDVLGGLEKEYLSEGYKIVCRFKYQSPANATHQMSFPPVPPHQDTFADAV